MDFKESSIQNEAKVPDLKAEHRSVCLSFLMIFPGLLGDIKPVKYHILYMLLYLPALSHYD